MQPVTWVSNLEGATRDRASRRCTSAKRAIRIYEHSSCRLPTTYLVRGEATATCAERLNGHIQSADGRWRQKQLGAKNRVQIRQEMNLSQPQKNGLTPTGLLMEGQCARPDGPVLNVRILGGLFE